MQSMFWPFLILLAAVVLLIFEVFIPSGGILGLLSSIAFVAAVVSAFMVGGLKLGTAFMAGVAVLIPVLIYLAIRWWPKTPIGKRILIQPPSADQLVTARRREREQWVGQTGVAATPLLPSGVIRIGRTQLDVISDGMTIEKGTPVRVVSISGTNLVVRPCSANEPPQSPSPDTAGSLDHVLPDPFEDPLP